MLDVFKLATLHEVVAHGSLSAAGDALGLTQPAVSRQMSGLERQTGIQLLHRAPRGVQPTQAGRLLADHAAVILDRLALAEAELADLAGLRRGHVRVGYFFTAFAVIAPEIVARIHADHPGVTMDHQLVDRHTAMHDLTTADLDVAIVFEHDFEPDPPPDGIQTVPLFEDPLRVLLPADHPLAAHTTLTLDDLADETWIRPHDGSAARLVDHVLRHTGLQPRMLTAGNGDEPVECQVHVAAGQGMMLAHDLNVLINPRQLAILPLADPAPTRHIQAALRIQQHAPAPHAVLRVARLLGDERRRRKDAA